jgi:hypothetical protein
LKYTTIQWFDHYYRCRRSGEENVIIQLVEGWMDDIEQKGLAYDNGRHAEIVGKWCRERTKL